MKSDTTTATRSAKSGSQEAKSRVAEVLSEAIEAWRVRIDHLKVQADLAKLDARDQATKQLDLAQNACLTASTRLREAHLDATVSVEDLGDGVRRVLEDVKRAFEAAQAAIARVEEDDADGR